MHDLSCAVLACAVPIEVTRHRATPIFKGRKQDNDVRTFTIEAMVYPTEKRELQRLPEGQRTEGMLTVLSVIKLHTVETSECRIADRFEYKSVNYQIDGVMDWFDLGGFYEMTATRLNR